MTATTLRERLIGLIEPLVEQLGYELVEIEAAPGVGQGKLTIYLDFPQIEGAEPREIGIEDCERVSHEVSALLDVEDPMPSAFTLEVSSPGDDRVLRKAKHFQRFLGSRVKVETAIARDGRRRYTGQLVEADERGFVVDVDGKNISIPYAELGRVRLAP